MLVIDKVKDWRKQGKYSDMEKQLYAAFKARRAKGRKVSGRWLTAMARLLMKSLHPLVDFKGGKDWRRRFSKRFGIGVRRKTNCKNKSFADSQPVLENWFKVLRRRLQLDADDPDAAPNDAGVESEPEDINPEHEDTEDPDPLHHGDDPLDSEDDSADEGMLVTLEMAMPSGRKIADKPTVEHVTFRDTHAGELVDKQIVYNWKGVGWVAGTITKAVKDGRVKNNGEQVNFVAFYSDETEGKHCLKLEAYGELDVRVHDQWVLLAQCD